MSRKVRLTFSIVYVITWKRGKIANREKSEVEDRTNTPILGKRARRTNVGLPPPPALGSVQKKRNQQLWRAKQDTAKGGDGMNT